MNMGLWTAYETAKIVEAARDGKASARKSTRQNRVSSRRGQLRAHIMKRDEQMRLLESIESQIAHPTKGRFDRLCPECGKALIVIQANDMEIETCRDCGGFWFDAGELKDITGRSRDVAVTKEPDAPSRFECPVCHESMIEKRFMQQHDLLVDLCPRRHGVYLEQGELEKAIDASLALKLRPDKTS